MAELYSLPDGWEWKKLGDLSEYINGMAFKPTDWTEEGFPIIRIQNLNGSNEYNYFNGEAKDKYYVKDGDILISWSASLDVYKWNGGNAILNQHIFNTEIKLDVVNYDFFYHTIKYSLSEIMKNLHGVGMKHITKGKFENIDVPLPPLEEQKRIVAKLDILFAKIDKVIALHQKNIDEADIFMASVLNDVFVELEEKYGLDNIGNMIDILTDYHSNGAYKDLKTNVELLDEEDYALMIRATDLENGDYTNNVKYITESAYNFMSKSKVFGGEIILPKIGTIGNVYFMPYLERPVSLAMNLFMLRCSDKVMNKYMFLFLKSPRGNENILNKANGAVTKTITKDAVRSIELPFPPLKTQQKVVAYLDEISQKMEKIKQIQKEKMQSLKALKASILDQAFKGEL